MATRSHFETFILLRNNALKNRSFYKDFNKDDERVKLVNGDDDEDSNEVYDLELSNFGVHNSNGLSNIIRDGASVPTWIASLEEFRYESLSIKEKIEQLKKLQEEHLKQQNTAIFADEVINQQLKTYELEIERKCHELNVHFNRLHSRLTHFKTLKSNFGMNKMQTSNRMVGNIVRNIFQYQVQEVVRLTQMFRSCQRLYIERRDEATRVDPQFVITFDEDLLHEQLDNDAPLIRDNVHHENSLWLEQPSSSSNNSKSDSYLQKQTQLFADQQLHEDINTNEQLRERQNEMNVIMKSFAELNQIFQEVNTLVVDQGSALDRIDYNLEQVEHRVELGAVSLEKAHRSITRMRKFKVVLGAGLLLFVILLFIILRS